MQAVLNLNQLCLPPFTEPITESLFSCLLAFLPHLKILWTYLMKNCIPVILSLKMFQKAYKKAFHFWEMVYFLIFPRTSLVLSHLGSTRLSHKHTHVKMLPNFCPWVRLMQIPVGVIDVSETKNQEECKRLWNLKLNFKSQQFFQAGLLILPVPREFTYNYTKKRKK